MAKWQRIVVILLICVLVGWSVYSIWSPLEPRYHGRKISIWLQDYPHYKQQDWREAEAAISSFGTNGIPYIFRHLKKPDTFWRKQHPRLWLNSPVWLRKILGPPKPSRTFDVTYAPEAFSLIGHASIPSLIEALEDDHPKVRTAALLALGGFGPDATAALPTLNELLSDSGLKQSDLRMIQSAIRRIETSSVVPPGIQRTNDQWTPGEL